MGIKNKKHGEESQVQKNKNKKNKEKEREQEEQKNKKDVINIIINNLATDTAGMILVTASILIVTINDRPLMIPHYH